MLKIAILMWVILSTTFAGAGILALLSTPSLGGQDMRLIPIVAAVGALLAVPVSVFVAKRILAVTAPRG